MRDVLGFLPALEGVHPKRACSEYHGCCILSETVTKKALRYESQNKKSHIQQEEADQEQRLKSTPDYIDREPIKKRAQAMSNLAAE